MNRRDFIASAMGAGTLLAGAGVMGVAAAPKAGKGGRSSSTIISGATVIDGLAERPVEGKSIWIEGGRIKAIGSPDALRVAPGARVIDGRGKYVIPGLMNGNVHLLNDVRLENLVRYMGRYEELIAEAAQVALKNGLTTVFDTWGPRQPLVAVRDRINAGETAGSRIFCAGNIIGFDGPFSPDFSASASTVASAALAKRINSMWVENVGRDLMWLPAEEVAREVRTYIQKGIDFIKYASNDHVPGRFLAFSGRTQRLMVEEAHRAGITAQAHTMTVEGLQTAVEAGCDLIQHANFTGPAPIPAPLLELMASRRIGVSVFPQKQRRLEIILGSMDPADTRYSMWQSSGINADNFIRSGVVLVLANDGALFAPQILTDPASSKRLSTYGKLGEDNLFDLGTGHFSWFEAMEERGCAPMEMLRAATRNVAAAYGLDKDFGTIEPGKMADMLLLDKNPLQAAANYRSIHVIVKAGTVVDRNALPAKPVLTAPASW